RVAIRVEVDDHRRPDHLHLVRVVRGRRVTGPLALNLRDDRRQVDHVPARAAEAAIGGQHVPGDAAAGGALAVCRAFVARVALEVRDAAPERAEVAALAAAAFAARDAVGAAAADQVQVVFRNLPAPAAPAAAWRDGEFHRPRRATGA